MFRSWKIIRNWNIKKIVLGALIFIAGAAVLYVLFVVFCSTSAFKQLEEGNYHAALLTFNKIPDLTEDISNGRQFATAGDLMDEGNYIKSRALFEKLGNFNGANLMFKEINYRIAKDKLLKEEYDSAIVILNSLGNYNDSETLLEYAKENLYNQAVKFYGGGQVRASAKIFEELKDYEDAEKYRILTSPKSLDELLSILDFENAKEVLVKSNFFIDFLCGTWESGKYNFIVTKNESSYHLNTNFCSDYSDGYTFLDGFLVGESSKEKYLEFTISSKDEIRILNLKTDLTKTFRKQ